MKNEGEKARPAPASQTGNEGRGVNPSVKPESPQERLERVEAALGLVLDHMKTATKGSEILEAEHTRNLLSSIALGLSSVALLALWSIALAREDIELNLMRFTVGMALLLLASVTDLASAPLLRRAVSRAILEKDPSRLVLSRRTWKSWFEGGYWAQIRRESRDFYHHQLARSAGLVVYIVSGGFLIWAVFTIE